MHAISHTYSKRNCFVRWKSLLLLLLLLDRWLKMPSRQYFPGHGGRGQRRGKEGRWERKNAFLFWRGIQHSFTLHFLLAITLNKAIAELLKPSPDLLARGSDIERGRAIRCLALSRSVGSAAWSRSIFSWFPPLVDSAGDRITFAA